MTRNELISIELIADEGMILTDGEHRVKAVLLAYGDDESIWKEIPEEEKQTSE